MGHVWITYFLKMKLKVINFDGLPLERRDGVKFLFYVLQTHAKSLAKIFDFFKDFGSYK